MAVRLGQSVECSPKWPARLTHASNVFSWAVTQAEDYLPSLTAKSQSPMQCHRLPKLPGYPQHGMSITIHTSRISYSCRTASGF
jgi:hypothetical protein